MTLIVLVFSFAAFPFLKKGPPSNRIERVGVIEATEVHLSSKISERIRSLPFQEGDTIQADTVAIQLDDRQIGAEVAEAEAGVQRGRAGLVNAKAQVEKAKANLEDAKRERNRLAALQKEGLLSDFDWDKARTRLELAEAEWKASEAATQSAEAELKEREAHLHLTQIKLKETSIVAPMTGVVTLKAFEVGEMVSPGATILTLVDLQSVWARVNLEEGEIGKVKLGGRAEISVDSLPGRTFEGKMIEVGAEAGFATQRDVTRGRQDIKTFRVKVRALSPEGLLKPGMTAKVRIDLES
ncbi:MAG: efflux RND transporter periplasmic adaptor subunit [Candidatus Manganitrophaceae bacterium]